MPLHTGQLWSLAIEEQFYLIWPLLVLKLSREALLKVSLCVVSAALTLRIGLSVGDVNPVAIFVLTPTRVDALVAGAIVAILVRSGVEARAWPILTGGAIVLAVILLQASTSQYKPLMQTIGFSALSLTFAGVIHWVVQHGNRPLSAPVLQFFGRYSYALYLLHGFAMVCVMELWPIAESHNIVIHWIVLRALLATGLAVAFALASWHLIEKWFLALKPSYEKEQTAGTEAEMVGAAGIGGVSTTMSRGPLAS